MDANAESSSLRASFQQPRDQVNRTSAALQGASMAFNNSYFQRKPVPGISDQGNGAMKAAVIADKIRRLAPASDDAIPASPEVGSVMDKIKIFSDNALSPIQYRNEVNGTKSHVSRPRSPQMIAATLAAERSATRTPNIDSMAGRERSPGNGGRLARKTLALDETTLEREQPAPKVESEPFNLPAPIPIRKISSKVPSMKALEANEEWHDCREHGSSDSDAILESAKGNNKVGRRHPTTTSGDHSRRGSLISQGDFASSQSGLRMPEGTLRSDSSGESLSVAAQWKPKLPPRAPASCQRDQLRIPLADQGILSRKTTRTSQRYDAESVTSASHGSLMDDYDTSARSKRTHYDPPYSNETSRVNEEFISDAMIASSLASSRTSSPAKVPPPLPPHRRSGSRSLLHPGTILRAESHRIPSPQKYLKQTLRDHPKSDDEAEQEKRHHRLTIIKHHPNKYHEGDRKRWRREITERQRKRYEGVWAANKGLWIFPDALSYRLRNKEQDILQDQLSEMVLNLVVRDIWSRSRLPSHVLEQIWDLVDGSSIGMLSREEFVVGMWLIDQQLKGHKLPVKVADSVWESIRYVSDIKFGR
ncbi:hypothetical protein Egran_03936 [Elaphomyces granulatus]|uniref:EH domain-containing protein n=1 Tax=Elaphomyces granulatus TaxID=519963 RepID=A0A232LVX6_9EURO|nr:hypothetical protein Egran_03936 [Elaphomyces granulatus]